MIALASGLPLLQLGDRQIAGYSPEWLEHSIQQAAAQAAGAANEAAERAKLTAELDRRGVAYSRSATRQQLLDLLRRNPAPKPGGKVVNAINKANPATLLLRTGVRLLLKANFMGIAEKLRYGFVSRNHARQKSLNLHHPLRG